MLELPFGHVSCHSVVQRKHSKQVSSPGPSAADPPLTESHPSLHGATATRPAPHSPYRRPPKAPLNSCHTAWKNANAPLFSYYGTSALADRAQGLAALVRGALTWVGSRFY